MAGSQQADGRADLRRRAAAEAFGTAWLLIAVVGSGIMAENLTKDIGLMLLVNSLVTGAVLVVVISILAPVSGSHLNPLVTLAMTFRRQLQPTDAAVYVIAQLAGALAGVVIAHLMFGLEPVSLSAKVRSGGGQLLAEAVAAFGLIVTIHASAHRQPSQLAQLVGLYVVGAYWFTSSTSFANPAVAVARAFTETFAGIRPADVPAFVGAEAIGALAAVGFVRWLLGDGRSPDGRRSSLKH